MPASSAACWLLGTASGLQDPALCEAETVTEKDVFTFPWYLSQKGWSTLPFQMARPRIRATLQHPEHA